MFFLEISSSVSWLLTKKVVNLCVIKLSKSTICWNPDDCGKDQCSFWTIKWGDLNELSSVFSEMCRLGMN